MELKSNGRLPINKLKWQQWQAAYQQTKTAAGWQRLSSSLQS
jgi:hypothetical protein